MSYFSELFCTKGINKYVLHTNKFGETAMWRIGDNGEAESFVCGDFADVICRAFNDGAGGRKMIVANPSPHDFGCSSWEMLCEKLNAKKRNKQKILWGCYWLTKIFLDYIGFDEENKKYVTKKLAKDEDGEDDE